jgi:hypothetical protein
VQSTKGMVDTLVRTALLEGCRCPPGRCTLRAEPTIFEVGRKETFGVRILDRAGREVHDLDEQHGQLMHLIVVRRDLTHYQLLHPSLDGNGRWSVPLALPEPGVYRAFADFSIGDEPLTLGVDLSASGELRSSRCPARPTRCVSRVATRSCSKPRRQPPALRAHYRTPSKRSSEARIHRPRWARAARLRNTCRRVLSISYVHLTNNLLVCA